MLCLTVNSAEIERQSPHLRGVCTQILNKHGFSLYWKVLEMKTKGLIQKAQLLSVCV